MEINAQALQLIDAYLQEVELKLAEQFPAQTCRERINEMRPHLVSMCQARLDLGDDPVRAVQSSIVRFGNPAEQVAKASPTNSLTTEYQEQNREALLFILFVTLTATIGAGFGRASQNYYNPVVNYFALWAVVLCLRGWYTRKSPLIYGIHVTLFVGFLIASALIFSSLFMHPDYTLWSAVAMVIAYLLSSVFFTSCLSVIIARNLRMRFGQTQKVR